MKTYGGSGGIAPPFLTSALDGEWLASRPGHFIPGNRAPGTHWIGGWVGPRIGLYAVKRKILTWRESNADRPARRHTDWAIQTPPLSVWYHYYKCFTVSVLSLLTSLWKNKLGLWYHVAVCVCVSPHLTSECLNKSIWNLVRISRHLSPSQRSNQINPPISLSVRVSLLGNGSVETLQR
jgi:hypothetical protein